MEASTWAAICSAIASVFSAIAASASFLIAWQVRTQQNKAADFNNSLEALSKLREAEKDVEAATGEDARGNFIHLMNVIEVLSMSVNNNNVPVATKEFLMKYLCETIAYSRADPDMAQLIRESSTGDSTFKETNLFGVAHSGEIERLCQAYVAIRTQPTGG